MDDCSTARRWHCWVRRAGRRWERVGSANSHAAGWLVFNPWQEEYERVVLPANEVPDEGGVCK